MKMRMNLESEEGEGQNNASGDADRNQDSVHVIHHAHLECHGHNILISLFSLSHHSKTHCLDQSEGAKKDEVDGKFPVFRDRIFKML